MPLDTNFTNQKFKQVGTRPLRPDGVDKVTGRAKYAEDFRAERMAFCKTLTSPMPHARIRNIDTSAATRVDSPSSASSTLPVRPWCIASVAGCRWPSA